MHDISPSRISPESDLDFGFCKNWAYYHFHNHPDRSDPHALCWSACRFGSTCNSICDWTCNLSIGTDRLNFCDRGWYSHSWLWCPISIGRLLGQTFRRNFFPFANHDETNVSRSIDRAGPPASAGLRHNRNRNLFAELRIPQFKKQRTNCLYNFTLVEREWLALTTIYKELESTIVRQQHVLSPFIIPGPVIVHHPQVPFWTWEAGASDLWQSKEGSCFTSYQPHSDAFDHIYFGIHEFIKDPEYAKVQQMYSTLKDNR